MDWASSFAVLKGKSTGSTSFAAIATALIPTVVTAGVWIVAFCLLRKPYRNIYAARTYFRSIPEKDRTPSSSQSALSWYHDFRVLDDKFLLRHSSIDAYLFLRFLRLVVVICVAGCCLTWPTLFPVNASAGGGATQLDRIAIGNVDGKKKLYAHAVVAWVFLGFAVLMITRERLFCINLRQAHASVKPNALRLSSRVVLFLGVPSNALDSNEIKRFFGDDAVKSWPVPNVTELEQRVSERGSKIESLEQAQLKLERKVATHIQKHQLGAPDGSTTAIATKLAKSTSRPKHRTHHVVGPNHDTIDDLREDIPDIESKIQELRDKHIRDLAQGSHAVFVEFKDQESALRSYRPEPHHHSPLSMQQKFISVQPKEVLWKNLNMKPSQRVSYWYLATALVVATTIFWVVPVGLVGTLSNINYLTDKVHFLRFVNNLPAPVLGFLTGFVPPFLLSTLVSYVPYFFRYVAKLSGQPTTVEAEKLTQRWFFAFQVIQVFIVTTFSSGAATVATKIANEPSSVPILLAKNLPKSSNFYLTYFIIQGLGSAAKNVINYSDLFEYIFYDYVFDRTPREKYVRRSKMKGIGWGSVYPKFANLTVIAIAYSCIAPLVLGFAAIGLHLFYLSYKHNLLYVIQVKVEARGVCYALALQHLMTGIYLAELCLFGLFTLRGAPGPATLMAVLLVMTGLHHFVVNHYLGPLEKYLILEKPAAEGESEGLLSRNRRGGVVPDKLPLTFLDPFGWLVEPRIFASTDDLRPYLLDPTDDDDIPHYTEDEVRNAYLNPALTSKTPKVWIPKDVHGVSKNEISENESAGLSTTDEGAELDAEGKLVWDKDNFDTVPIFKIPKKY
jgi:calcium permeable stress-gated cation channel